MNIAAEPQIRFAYKHLPEMSASYAYSNDGTKQTDHGMGQECHLQSLGSLMSSTLVALLNDLKI